MHAFKNDTQVYYFIRRKTACTFTYKNIPIVKPAWVLPGGTSYLTPSCTKPQQLTIYGPILKFDNILTENVALNVV